MLRAFIAIEIPDTVRLALAKLQTQLRQDLSQVRWVRPDGIHLTLRFLGDIPEERVDPIGRALEGPLRGRAPFQLGLRGLGAFPGVRKARVIWAGLCGDTAALTDLQQEVETALDPVGFRREKRRFKAHLTLGRCKKSPPADRLVAAMEAVWADAPCEFPVNRVVLYRSELRPQGARYSPLVEVPFGEGTN